MPSVSVRGVSSDIERDQVFLREVGKFLAQGLQNDFRIVKLKILFVLKVPNQDLKGFMVILQHFVYL